MVQGEGRHAKAQVKPHFSLRFCPSDQRPNRGSPGDYYSVVTETGRVYKLHKVDNDVTQSLLQRKKKKKKQTMGQESDSGLRLTTGPGSAFSSCVTLASYLTSPDSNLLICKNKKANTYSRETAMKTT